MRLSDRVLCAFLLALAATSGAPLHAAELEVRVRDGRGEPVADAVVMVEAQGVEAGQPQAGSAVMAQRNHAFDPFVLPVRVGTEVAFPNHDRTRHHVYSFSPVKPFELKLYRGEPGRTITFERQGVVVLGCNIHDYMQGYIYVTDATRFQTSGNDGGVRFESLDRGRYEISVWHPWQTVEPRSRSVGLTASDEAGRIDFELDLNRPPPRRPRGNALQTWAEAREE